MTHEQRSSDFIYAAGVIAVMLLVVGVWHLSKGDVGTCRDLFRGLAKGRQLVAGHIDWEHFKALDADVGVAYAKLSTNTDRRQYRMAFIAAFAKGFSMVGAKPDAFVNWRLHERTPTTAVIAADYAGKQKTLLVTMSTVGKKQLQEIQWAP